jgi:hypothetical protein
LNQLGSKTVIDSSLGLSVIVAVSLYSNLDQVSTPPDYFAWTSLRHAQGLTLCAQWYGRAIERNRAQLFLAATLFQETPKRPLLRGSKASAKG